MLAFGGQWRKLVGVEPDSCASVGLSGRLSD